MEYLKDPRKNKGLSFTLDERKSKRLNGLLPTVVFNQYEQVERVLDNLRTIASHLQKYLFLINLLDSDEHLFYCVFESNIEEIMPLVYTPTVGDVCLNYGLIYDKPNGMFITINDKGRVYEILDNWPDKDIRVIVVTDGERILGLGDLGAHGMGIPVGKLALYTALACVNPEQCLPILLDVGTNNQRLLEDKYYLGLKQKRVTNTEYYEFCDEFMESVKRRFGPSCLIQFEDFGNKTAFYLLKKYQNKYCMYNDDIQGTASVTLAGLLTAAKITKIPLKEKVFLFYGAGEAALGISNLIVLALVRDGTTEDEARKRIWLIDSKGLVVKNRTEGLNERKLVFSKEAKPMKNLADIIDYVKPTVLIGCAGIGNVFTKEVIEQMTSFNQTPNIFALSNPTSKSECTAEDAYTYTNGNVVFASGSPFDKFKYGDRTYITAQANNCYIFPAIGLAVASCGIKHISDDFFLVAAKCLSSQVTDEEISEGRIYPNLQRIRDVSFKIACDVSKYALDCGLCSEHIEQYNLEKILNENIYKSNYDFA